MEYKEDIEQLVKNTFDDFEADVSPDAWMNIQNGLNAQHAMNAGSGSNSISTGAKVAAGSSKFGVGSIIGIAATAIGITAAIVYFTLNNDKPVASEQMTAISSQTNEAPVSQNAAPVLQLTNAETKNNSEHENFKKDAVLSSSASPAETAINHEKNIEKSGQNNSNEVFSTNENISQSTLRAKAQYEIKIPEDKKVDADVPPVNNQPAPQSTISEGLTPKESDAQNEEATEPNIAADITSDKSLLNDTKEIEKQFFGQIPDVITPNSDGKNDVFVIEGNDIMSLKVSIFDRSGKVIHHWNNLHGFWDGKLENGQPAASGIYFYDIFAQTNSGKPLNKKGTIHLLLK